MYGDGACPGLTGVCSKAKGTCLPCAGSTADPAFGGGDSKCRADDDEYCWAREETLFIASVGAQTKSAVSLTVLEQKFGWAVGLSTSVSLPSQQ